MRAINKILSLFMVLFVLFGGIFQSNARATDDTEREIRVASRFWELFFKDNEEKENERPMLIPSGRLFGLRLKTDGVIVVETQSESGLFTVGDIIVSVDGKKLSSAQDLRACLTDKTEVTIRYIRDGKEVEVRHPIIDGKIGVTVKDSALGIGTVTYINPDTGAFGGLGHGISDATTGNLLSISSGDVTDVTLGGVTRGAQGKPGELCGVLRQNDKGDVYINDACGVFGKLDSTECFGEPLPIAYRDEVHEGEATLLCTVRQGKTLPYQVRIRDIDTTSTTSKSFLVEVTDPALIALTGGIVRGMSGSPIIQDGHLIGAVTHVMVADPTEGYGIFIENMLNAAEGQMQPKAA